MKARLQLSTVVVLALFVSLSCARPPFSLLGVHSAVSTVYLFDRQGENTASYESLSVFIESEEGANLQMEVSSPDGLNTWFFTPTKKLVDKQPYYGRSGLSLGTRSSLQRGQWLVRLLRDDGRTLTEYFFVEEGHDPKAFLHQLDVKEGSLVLDGQVKECAIQLLDEQKKVLHASTTTDLQVDLKSLYPAWDKVRFLGLTWYDESARMNLIAWYEL